MGDRPLRPIQHDFGPSPRSGAILGISAGHQVRPILPLGRPSRLVSSVHSQGYFTTVEDGADIAVVCFARIAIGGWSWRSLNTGVTFSRSQVLNTFSHLIEAVCLQLQSAWKRVSTYPMEDERLSMGTHLPLADIM